MLWVLYARVFPSEKTLLCYPEISQPPPPWLANPRPLSPATGPNQTKCFPQSRADAAPAQSRRPRGKRRSLLPTLKIGERSSANEVGDHARWGGGGRERIHSAKEDLNKYNGLKAFYREGVDSILLNTAYWVSSQQTAHLRDFVKHIQLGRGNLSCRRRG